MNIRLFKKDLQHRGLTIKALISFYEDVKKGLYVKKDYIAPRQVSPSETAYIYKSELDFISKCILDYKNIETGGQLFGYWTSDGSPVVIYAIGPGANANHQAAFFNQDVDYLVTIGKVLVHHYGLQHIGEWHSHHKLRLAQPSGHDASTIADTIREKHLPQFLLCIGNCSDTESTINPFNFTYNAGYNYVKAQWIVKDIDSPFRNLIDRELRNHLILPKTQSPCYKMGGMRINTQFVNPAKSGYWFEDKQNRLALKNIMDFLSSFPNQGQCSIQMDSCNHIHLHVKRMDREEHLYFPEKFPLIPPDIKIQTSDGSPVHVNNKWIFDGDIFDSFVKYYKSIYNYDGR